MSRGHLWNFQSSIIKKSTFLRNDLSCGWWQTVSSPTSFRSISFHAKAQTSIHFKTLIPGILDASVSHNNMVGGDYSLVVARGMARRTVRPLITPVTWAPVPSSPAIPAPLLCFNPSFPFTMPVTILSVNHAHWRFII